MFLRKFRLLSRLTPDLIPLTVDLLEARDRPPPQRSTGDNEAWVQAWLCRKMTSPGGLRVPVGGGDITLGYLAHELPTGEGTRNPERLDILGVDRQDRSLVAFEIKGPRCGRVDLENLLLQGVEHRDWLEENKMGVKFVLEGPHRGRISTRKRVRLLVGFFGERIPPLFLELRHQALRRDRHLRIDFVRFQTVGDGKEGFDLQRFA